MRKCRIHNIEAIKAMKEREKKAEWFKNESGVKIKTAPLEIPK